MLINHRALTLGTVFFAVTYTAYLGLMYNIHSFPPFMRYAPYVLVAISGAIIGRYTTRALITNCWIGGALASVIAGVLNYCLWLLDVPVDFGGLKMSAIAVLLMMPFFMPLALFGGAFGRKEKKDEST